MKEDKIREFLKNFLSGNLELGELSDVIDDRLCDLRQKPDLTPEQEILSNLELVIHETQEGFRSFDELLKTIMSAIEINDAEETVTTIILNTSTGSGNNPIMGATPVRDYRPEYQFV